jgi:hypothetical protein
MICIKQIWTYLVCALTLISAPLWGKTELPVLPATVAVQGLSLHINPLQSTYDANTGFSGAGTMFFPAIGRELPVIYTNVRLDAQAHWQSGNVKARIAPDLLKAAAIGDLEHPKFVDNFNGLKNFIKAAHSHTDELPLMLNTLPSYQNANFGSLAVMLTEINVSKEGTTASMMALERMPEGIYLPFTRTGVVFDPLSMQPFKEMQLDLSATADVTDVQLPITFKAGDATGTTGTYVTFDCNGLKVFHVEGFHKFTSGIITPSPASAPAVIATFSADVKSLRQFVVKVTLPKFTIAGFDDVAFEITDAMIDYSDSENPTTFPQTYFTEMGNTAPTKRETWKGIHIGIVAISLPTLPMRDKDGKPFTFAAKDMIYDKGNGFSATLFIKTDNIANVNVKGFSLKLDEFNLRLRKNSVQDLNFLGSVGIPVLKDEKGSLKYKATFNTSGDKSQASFQLSVQMPDDLVLEVPFLELAKCKLQKSSVLTMQMRDGSPLVFANLHGSFDIGTVSPKLSMGLPFEGWKIGDDPSVLTTSGAEELPMSFKAFDTNGGGNAAPEKKMSGFPLSIDGIGFKSVKGTYQLSMTVGITLGGKSSFTAKGGMVISSGLQFSKLVSLKPWEGIEYKGIALQKLEVDAQMSTFSFQGELELLTKDPIYGEGFKAAVTLKVKAGKEFVVDARSIFGNKDGYSYFYVDGNFTMSPGIPFVTPLSIHTFGGGVYYNMKQTLSGDGKTNTYVPQKDVFGLIARMGVGLQNRETFDAVGELQFEFGSDWALRFFKITAKAGALNDFSGFSISAQFPYAKSKIAGACTMMYDNVNQNITVNAWVQLQNISIQGRAEMNMFFDLKDKSNWYVRLGTPRNPAYVSWGPMRVGMYIMLGKGIGDLPNIGEIVPELVSLGLAKEPKREDFNKKTSPSATGSGFAFGISYKMEQNFSFLMFSGGIKAAFGVDALLNNNLECNGQKIGWNGWYMKAQAYAYLGARVDIDVNLLFIKGKFNIAELQVGAILEAQLPEPMLLRGRVAARFSVLGGVVSGKFNIGFQLKKGDPCNVENYPTSPAVGQPVVSATYPDIKEEIQVFDDIIVSTNLAVRDVQTYEFTNDNGDVSRHFYKVRLTQVDIMEGTKKLATMTNADVQFKDDFTFVLTPHAALPQKTNLKLIISAEAYDTDIDGRVLKPVGKETRTVDFKTGARPEKIYNPMISYSAPGADQKYWYKGYAKPKVTLKQTGYEYLFDPNYKDIPSEYKWILYKKQGMDSTIVGTYDLSGTLNGFEEVKVTVTNGTKCGYTSHQVVEWSNKWYGRVPNYKTVVTANTCTYTDSIPSRSFSFNKLNELDLDKQATYRIEVIRRPKLIQQKAIATSNVSTTNAVAKSDTENEASMATRSLSVTKSNAQEVAILYTNVFSISKVNDIADKIKLSEKPLTETVNSLGQPRKSNSDNLEGDMPTAGYRPYLTVVGTVEPLDKYDIQRIIANSAFSQSSGLDYPQRFRSRNSKLKGKSGTEYYVLLDVATSYFRDKWYNTKIMDASLENFVRPGNTGPELVFNSVNVQWTMSEQMGKSSYYVYVNHPNCHNACTYVERAMEESYSYVVSGVFGWFTKWATRWVTGLFYECKDRCYKEESTFIQDWTHNVSSNRYNPGNYPINGTYNYTTPGTIPEFFTEPVAGTVKTYNFNFTPPAR